MTAETELSFLVRLLLDFKLPKAVRESIADRIRAVESTNVRLQPAPAFSPPQPAPSNLPAHIAMQSPSTQAALIRHASAQLVEGNVETPVMPPMPEAKPEVAQVAHTPAAAAAIASRNAAINAGISGTIDKINGRPRKF